MITGSAPSQSDAEIPLTTQIGRTAGRPAQWTTGIFCALSAVPHIPSTNRFF